jgi:hypothetical protein
LACMVVPMKRCDHWAEAAGHEPLATRARATPAGALAWVAYVWVVITFVPFTVRCVPTEQGIALL